jgi:GGDEF domain-containing protein
MALTLILPWFPILLGVGIGGRLLGPTRGLFLGLLSALFWTVLVQAALGPSVWGHSWTVAAIVAGSVAIAAMGAWSGQHSAETTRLLTVGAPAASGASALSRESAVDSVNDIGRVVRQFDEWLSEHGDEADPWPKFDEFVRFAMRQMCGARHVKPFRIASESEDLVPLIEPDPLGSVEHVSTNTGVIGQVIATGRAFVAAEANIDRSASMPAGETHSPVAWCFAITEGNRRRGVVCVGQVGVDPVGDRALLETIETVINLFWHTLIQTVAGRSARQNDPVSTLLIRPAFLRRAEHALRQSYRSGEPVAIAVFSVEGLRRLNDGGRWRHADELIAEFSAALKRKSRSDDCVGRFDGSRFVLLLRRVDLELGGLIVGQLLSRLKSLCADELRWGAGIVVRCGIAGSGAGTPDIETLLKAALANAEAARCQGVDIIHPGTHLPQSALTESAAT